MDSKNAYRNACKRPPILQQMPLGHAMVRLCIMPTLLPHHAHCLAAHTAAGSSLRLLVERRCCRAHTQHPHSASAQPVPSMGGGCQHSLLSAPVFFLLKASSQPNRLCCPDGSAVVTPAPFSTQGAERPLQGPGREAADGSVAAKGLPLCACPLGLWVPVWSSGRPAARSAQGGARSCREAGAWLPREPDLG